MEEKASREELEEFLRERSAPGFAAAMMSAMEDLPEYVMNLGMLRTAVDGLERVAEPCACQNPDCLASPAHKDLYEQQLEEAIGGLQAAAETMFQAIVEMCFRVEHCSCLACQTAGKRHNSLWN